MFAGLQSHYLFDDRFGRPGKGNDKGKVEGLVGYVRRNFMVPIPAAASIEELNARFADQCRRRGAAVLRGQSQSITARMEADSAAFMPLPEVAFDPCHIVSGCASSMALVRYRTNDYSVPTAFAHQQVVIKGYVDRVDIVCRGTCIASHVRSYEREDFIANPLHYLALLEQNEGAKFWLRVMNELRNRGVEDILLAVVDGLKGFPDAITAVFPDAIVQTCIVHLLRNSMDFVSWKDRKNLASALKEIYRATDADAAEKALTAFEAGPWGQRYPAIGQSWRRAWGEVIPFFAFPDEVRRIIYTTNAIEASRFLQQSLLYDNTRLAVARILGDGRRERSRMFAGLQSHYLFDDRFGRPGKGNDKGKVEGLVGYVRRNFMVPIPAAASIEELNARFADQCRRRGAAVLRGQSQSITARMEADSAAFMPLPEVAFDPCHIVSGCASSMALVRYRTNDYSVPTAFAHQQVVIKGYVDRVDIVCRGTCIASHVRSYEREDFIANPLHYLALLEQNEGAKFWLRVMNELRNRGVEDILLAVVDGLKGFPDAITAVFPDAIVQTCIVHLLRNSMDFVSWKDRKNLASALKEIYRATDADAAEKALTAFEAGPWGQRYPAIGQSWRRAWGEVIPFFAFPDEVRRIIYTTNAIEACCSTDLESVGERVEDATT
uniref:IstA n=1 Tax=Brevundimonas diminuta TaxID=293 RepID=G8DNV6_BREDI|nr:IstA [Brevundimonas diminuta]